MTRKMKRVLSDVFTDETVVEYLFRMYSYDISTFRHMLHTCRYAAVIADKLFNYDKMLSIAKGAALHDIGKLNVPSGILNKADVLTSDEYTRIRGHPVDGYELVKEKVKDDVINDIILHHHEHVDGSGYPDGISGDSINPEVRIVTVVDVFDAMTSDRAYHKALCPEAALKLMAEQEYEGEFINILREYVLKEGVIR